MTKKLLRLTMILLIVIECLLGALYHFIMLSDSYSNAIKNHFENYPIINLRLNNRDLSEKAYEFLLSEAEDKHFILYRYDTIIDSLNAELSGVRIGVYVPTSAPSMQSERLEFLGNSLYTNVDLTDLMRAESMKTLGVEFSHKDALKAIPSFPSQFKLVVYKLEDLRKFSDTVESAYYVEGITNADYQTLIQKVSAITGSEASLLVNQSVSVSNESLLQIILFYALIASSIILVVLMITYTTTLYKKLGAYLLLGWSHLDFAKRNLSIFVWIAFISIPLHFVIFFSFTQGFSFTLPLVLHIFSLACLPLLIVLFAVSISAMTLCAIKPVCAIRNQIRIRTIFILMLILYLGVTGLQYTALRGTDAPLARYNQLGRVSRQWEKVNKFYLLYQERIGDDVESFSRRSTKYAKDFYNWYQSVENEPGVYLIQTTNYDEEQLNSWRANGSYAHVPLRPFWYFTTNVNYLKEIHFSVSEEAKRAINDGVRVYFIPSSYSDREKAALQDWLKESSGSRLNGDIQTKFMQNPRFEFIEYDPNEQFFTWATKENESIETSEPIIYLADTNNMTWFENESLFAKGLENSYVKLDTDGIKRYTSIQYLDQFQLSDNEQTWLSSADYVDGIQNSIRTYLQLFLSMILVLIFLGMFLVLSIAGIYANHYRERLAVKRLLGYGIISIFKLPFAVITLTNSFFIILAVVFRTNVGLIVFPLVYLIQTGILVFYTKAASQKQMTQLIKEG